MKIYLGNLSKSMSDAQLNELVTPYGKANSAEVAKDRKTGESKGFGFVEFGTDEEAKAAISALDGKEVQGQTIKVNEARPKNDGAPRPAATPGH
jgi:cold-inducible RNA-binding protein